MRTKSAVGEKNRKTEILDACLKLYREKGFHDITIKDISMETSFSRPSIYNYYQTKAEIFLGILIREYDLWADDLEKTGRTHRKMTADKLAQAIGETLENRQILLKVSAMNLYEIEENSRYELLVEFKKAFRRALAAFQECILHFCEVTDERAEEIRSAFFPFMYGIYPYVYPTDKQKKAMDETGIRYKKTSIREITYRFLKQIL